MTSVELGGAGRRAGGSPGIPSEITEGDPFADTRRPGMILGSAAVRVSLCAIGLPAAVAIENAGHQKWLRGQNP